MRHVLENAPLLQDPIGFAILLAILFVTSAAFLSALSNPPKCRA